MNLNELREALRNAQNELTNARNDAGRLTNDANATTEQLTEAANVINRINARINLINRQIADAEANGHPAPVPTPAADQTRAERLHDIRASREYARAFADAVRCGVNPVTGRGDSRYNVLYDAMTIGGGDPAGEDGGFLVPEDMDHTINEFRRQYDPLADLFNQESVSTQSGWRIVSTNPAAGMAAIDEMGQVQAGEQPVFSKVSYSLTKYGLYIPVSNELLSDEVAGLMAYLSRWIAKKCVIQENTLLLAKLALIEGTAISEGDELGGIKTALNVALDPAISLNASILTNQSGFNVLDNLVDGQGRPLIHMDVTTGTPKMLGGRTVHVVSDAVLPNESTNTKAPVYIGDFAQYATLFSRNPVEIRSTDVGGSAWRTDSTEVRALKRMGVSVFDSAAVVHRTLAL